MKTYLNNLKRAAEEQPLVALAIAAAALTAASKVMDSNTARVAAKTHAAEVARRIANSNR